ncbi:type VI secretion system Vgr family protein [Cellvibrio sp. PSBB006]|uniref:type VI secretion system Vgr family protein n=1 Tax=Cellvibrio sp. PSBB006 TaxID=1987723 RepID=UPI000B3B45AC|nr:type VI secretion system tip protein TssI/VgrG [Cellvibrio sp. PSBB006]ARU26525.1 type VI secretion protein Vgr [Cellvibrio sp. PSBB006]
MSQLTQENRLISITDFSLGKDTFLLTAFEGVEYISGLFEFNIEVLSENLEVDPDNIVGKTATVTIQNDQERKFNGYIKSFTFGEVKANNLRQYRMVMVPWLWFLSQTNDHRIFQEKNTKEIVSQIFNDLGFSDFDFKAAGGNKREYCVQHNESDLNFISRLLEEDGIAYYFEHDDKKHKLVLVDQQNAYTDVAETNLEYSKGNTPNTQITAWEHIYLFKKGKWSLNDYNFKEPKKDLNASTKTKSQFAKNDTFEHYEYPGLYDTTMGADLVKIRLDAEEVDRNTVKGSSDCSSFFAGGKFKVAKHATSSEKGSYILARVFHKAHDNSYFSGSDGSSDYKNDFICIPSDVHFRPSNEHKKPVMKGPQSALVVGPAGEEIYIDEHNRIKVQFIWDREGKKDENSSCFVRVMQAWAGNQWGSSFIPRIGHEVIVSFLDGDPDRPLVTGSVYNGWNKPTYPSKTQSGIKTRSTKDGTPQNFNELRFEDKKGDEQIYVHAEKNFDTQVENDQTLTVDHDRTKTIGNDENSSIGNDRNKSVGNNQTESIGKNKTIDVGENHTESIGKNMSLSVGKNISIDIGENHTETIGKNMTISVGKDLSESVDGKYTESVTKEYALTAKTITLQADDQITLKTGSASIVMKKNGDITISGKNINVKGSGNVVLKGSKITNN